MRWGVDEGSREGPSPFWPLGRLVCLTMLPSNCGSVMGIGSAAWAQSVHLPLGPQVRPLCPLLPPSICCSLSCTLGGGRDFLQVAGVYRNLRSSFSWAFTLSLLFTRLCSLTPSRQTQSTCGFALHPPLGVCLGPWALAHDMMRTVSPGRVRASPVLPVPVFFLSVPWHPTPFCPGSAHTGNTLDFQVLHLHRQSSGLLLTASDPRPAGTSLLAGARQTLNLY